MTNKERSVRVRASEPLRKPESPDTERKPAVAVSPRGTDRDGKAKGRSSEAGFINHL